MKFQKVQSKTKEELKSIIEKAIGVIGNDADLNFIDTSKMTDMSGLFFYSLFNGDISGWNVSNVKNMDKMFYGSCFNGDISKWDVSNVKKHLQFNQDSKLEDKNCPKFVNNLKYGDTTNEEEKLVEFECEVWFNHCSSITQYVKAHNFEEAKAKLLKEFPNAYSISEADHWR